MNARRRELVATDEPTMVSKPLPDAVMVEDGQSDGRFPDPPCANESDWNEAFCETNNLLDQLLTSKAGPWRRGRELSRCGRFGHGMLDSLTI